MPALKTSPDTITRIELQPDEGFMFDFVNLLMKDLNAEEAGCEIDR